MMDASILVRRGIAIAILATLAACGSAEPSATTGDASAPPLPSATTEVPGTQAPEASPAAATPTASPGPQDSSRFFQIDQVVFGPASHVVLRNFTGEMATLAGLYLCDAPDCKALPDVDVPAQTSVILAMGDGAGLDGVAASDLGLTLEPAGGEIGLYASDSADVAADVRSYLEWGSTPHEGTPTAIEAGLWLEGSYAPTLPTAKRLFRNEGGGWIFE